MAKVDSLEAGQRQNQKEIKSLTGGAVSLRRENAALREEVSSLKKRKCRPYRKMRETGKGKYAPAQ